LLFLLIITCKDVKQKVLGNGYCSLVLSIFSLLTLAIYAGRPIEYERAYFTIFVLGVVYSRVPDIDERKVYDIAHLTEIPSVAKDFSFFLQEKYRIASDGPGSGNTKNRG
jgi:hypothetical protein